VSGRHTALGLSAGRRPLSLLLTVATVLGLWFGVRAPEVSPVAPTDQMVGVQTVDDGPAGRRDGR
jgi:hypothetical protein